MHRTGAGTLWANLEAAGPVRRPAPEHPRAVGRLWEREVGRLVNPVSLAPEANDEFAARAAAASGDPRLLEDRGVQKALGGSLVHAQQPPGPDAQRSLRDARNGLQRLLDASVASLVATRGLPAADGGQPELEVHAPHDGEPAGATGQAGLRVAGQCRGRSRTGPPTPSGRAGPQSAAGSFWISTRATTSSDLLVSPCST